MGSRKGKSKRHEGSYEILNILKTLKIDGTDIFSSLDGLTASAAELNLNDNQPAAVVITVTAEVANDVDIAFQFNDAAGVAMAVPVAVQWYLASDAAGLDPQTTAHDGGIVIDTDGALIESVANLSGLMISEADGDVDVTITDAGAFTAYFVVVMPNGLLTVSEVLTHTA